MKRMRHRLTLAVLGLLLATAATAAMVNALNARVELAAQANDSAGHAGNDLATMQLAGTDSTALASTNPNGATVAVGLFASTAAPPPPDRSAVHDWQLYR